MISLNESIMAYNCVISKIPKATITIEEQILVLALIGEEDMLTESTMTEGLKDIGAKLGLHVSKGKGLIDYFKQFTTGIGKLFMLLLKGDKEGALALSKSIKKEDVVHFLLQLDQATLHLVTGPIHILDAVTGWHSSANLKTIKAKATETATAIGDKLKTAFTTIKTSIHDALDGKRAQSLHKKVSNI